MEKEYEVIEVAMIGLVDKKTGILENVVYHNERNRHLSVYDVSPTGWESMKSLFINLIGKKKDE